MTIIGLQSTAAPFTRVGSKVQSLQRPPLKSPYLLALTVFSFGLYRPPESGTVHEHSRTSVQNPCRLFRPRSTPYYGCGGRHG